MSKIISLTHYRKAREQELKTTKAKADALAKVQQPQKNPETFNHQFYQLVDLFLRENYPDAFWRFDVWLEGIKTKGGINE